MFQGLFTALMTPFTESGIDEDAFTSLVDWQVNEGVHGVVPVGTTGESPTLSHKEHMRLIELCVKTVAGRVPVMAGTGSNSTDEALMFTRHAHEAGANAALIVSPYYNKPTQEGLYQHYKVLNSVGIPIFVYNIPGRSVIDIKDETLARLSELENIVGVKDATGDLARIANLRNLIGDKLCLVSGEDATTLSFNALGGKGCISVTSNIAPKLCSDMQNAWFAGDAKKALSIHDRLMPLHNAMFCETSPSPVKYAASLMGLCDSRVRLPLVPPSKEHQKQIKDAMVSAGILSA